VAALAPAYRTRRPQDSTLYAVVRDNLATLFGAVDDGAVSIALPAFVRKGLEGFLECGLLCRGFAHVACGDCASAASWRSRVNAEDSARRVWRRMASTAANLVECILPPSPLRQ
jgi:hypothetical protein